MKVKEFLKEENWTKKGWGVDHNGEAIDFEEIDNAVKVCLLGAIVICYKEGYDLQQANNKLRKVLQVKRKGKYLPNSIILFNDDKDTTWEMVKEVLEEADV